MAFERLKIAKFVYLAIFSLFKARGIPLIRAQPPRRDREYSLSGVLKLCLSGKQLVSQVFIGETLKKKNGKKYIDCKTFLYFFPFFQFFFFLFHQIISALPIFWKPIHTQVLPLKHWKKWVLRVALQLRGCLWPWKG